MLYADGGVFEGHWKADLPEGRGTARCANGEVYEGEWSAVMGAARFGFVTAGCS